MFLQDFYLNKRHRCWFLDKRSSIEVEIEKVYNFKQWTLAAGKSNNKLIVFLPATPIKPCCYALCCSCSLFGWWIMKMN